MSQTIVIFIIGSLKANQNPSNDPVILWLNGGPGCSSLGGMFNEIGPWRVNDDGKTLRVDNSSWNQMANIIFFESPAGVGFSYQEQNNLATDDGQTALDNYLALKEFFVKFPSFKTNDFFYHWRKLCRSLYSYVSN
jgi:cathepsin A (carboxypeptidase C)